VHRKTLSLVLALLILLCTPLTASAAKLVAKYGSKGRRVEEVQSMLQKLKFYRGEIDGEYGKQTRQAVTLFQKKNKKKITGSVDWPLYNLMSKKSGLSFGQYRKIWTMEATGYSPSDPGVTGITSTGRVMRRGIVAVDPYIIPLGTRLYIMGYGEGVAADVGSAIKGNHIDLAFMSRREALQWGRRRVRVYIL
jgi:3D (Asp-Asp-Asp) domain-containing protein